MVVPLLDLLVSLLLLRLLSLLLGLDGVLVIPGTGGVSAPAGGRLVSPPLQPQPGGLHLLHLAAELVGVLLVPGRLLLLAAALPPALIPTEMEQTF